jgi:hypothetical protein
MKKFYVSLLLILVCQLSFAQLKIYQNLNLQGTTGTCLVNTVYKSATIPGGLNNVTKSISLDSGFMATLAENEDGSGERFTYMAAKSKLNVNLALQLQSKVSFIRVLKLPNTKIKKKGVGATNVTEANLLNATWGYNWGLDAIVPTTREFAPMVWGTSGASDTNLDFILNKDSITHYLAFNEPDDYIWPYQSNIFVHNAVPLYKKMLRNGLRMGSPVCTEGKWKTWLDSFYTRAITGDITNDTLLAVDYITLHWYDWGNWSQTGNANPTGQQVLDRFKADITAAYNKFKKPIWITEFNANINRDSTVHLAFMQLALPFLDTCRMVERYAYFFGNDVKSRKSDGSLTPLGQFYADHASVNAYTENVYDKRTPYQDTTLAAWDPSAILLGGFNNATFAPTYLYPTITANTPLSRGTGLLPPPSNSSNGYWGATNFSTVSYTDAINTNKILKFALQGNTGNYVNYSSLDKFNIRINNIGPVNYVITYQIVTGGTAGTVTTIATITGTPAVTGNYSFGPFDLTGFTNLQNVPSGSYVIFRIVPYGGSSSSGSFLIGSGTGDTNYDLSVRGFTSPTTLIVPNTEQAPLLSRVISIDNMQPSSVPFIAYPTLNTSNSIKATFKATSKNAQIKVVNMNGQVMASYKLQEGVNMATIATGNLQKGSYVLVLEDGNSVQNTRFIKQ